jgi:hypothetical protein
VFSASHVDHMTVVWYPELKDMNLYVTNIRDKLRTARYTSTEALITEILSLFAYAVT